MIRNIKALALALVAALAMSAVVASGASAANFTASSYPASGSGGQTTKHVFTVQGHRVECVEATFTGSLIAASPQITINASYAKCTAFGWVGATIDMNSCDYLFTAGSGTIGSVHIVCSTPGDSITITAGGCVVHIPAQTPTTPTVDYANVHPGVRVTSTATGIHSNVTSGFGCTLESKSTDTSGVYHGSTQFTGHNGVTVDVG